MITTDLIMKLNPDIVKPLDPMLMDEVDKLEKYLSDTVAFFRKIGHGVQYLIQDEDKVIEKP